MEKPLEGIRVVDCTLAGAGPSCTKLLTEYGAQTIWIEAPGGASTRDVFKYDFYCAKKRSIVLNLKTENGRKIFERLVRNADVFVTNYRPQALKKLKMTYEDLYELNPKLIYASLTAFGEQGEDSEKPGYDPVAYWSRGGMLQDFAEKGSILVPPVAVGDITSGQALAGGICAALFQRERTGKGTKVFTSLMAQAGYINHDALIGCQYGEEYPKTRKAPRRSLLNSYKCKDGKWLTITIVNRFDKYFAPLLTALGREDLAGDPRWTCLNDTMYEGAPEVVDILDEAFAKLTCEEALERLHAVDVPVCKVQSTADYLKDKQAWENGYLFEITDHEGKQLTVPANPVKFGDIDSGIKDFGIGPRLGEHTEEVLKEYGYSGEEIRKFFEDHVVE